MYWRRAANAIVAEAVSEGRGGIDMPSAHLIGESRVEVQLRGGTRTSSRLGAMKWDGKVQWLPDKRL